MQLTITTVYPKPRSWQGKYGPSADVTVVFDDGSEGKLTVNLDKDGNQEKALEHVERLKTLIGKPSEFEIDDSKEREYQGVIQRKIVSYPGKPESGQGKGGFGGGGGRPYTPAWANTEEGERFVQERTDRRTALMQAVLCRQTADEKVETTLHRADLLYGWLEGTIKVKQTPAAPQKEESAPQATGAAQETQTATEHAPNPRGRFFALWSELNFPSDVDYSRYVLRSILAKAGIQKPVKSREELTEGDWKLAASGLRSYSTMLVRNGIKPMKEADFVPEEPEWEETE